MNAPQAVRRLYCSYFDSAYLARGLAFLGSLRRCDPSARILVLALDGACERVLRERFPGDIDVIGAAALHDSVPELRRLREQRSPWAYYATHKPALALFAMGGCPRPDGVLFVDADTWFFSDPEPMFEEIGSASVALSPHRFPDSLRRLEKFGRYNAGCVYWRNDETGRRCLADWLRECLEWCSEEPQTDGRFMNQGYLNRWPERYPGAHILRHRGVNLAPWNIDGHRLDRHRESLLVDGQPLIFYHYHGLARDSRGCWLSHFPHLTQNETLAKQAIYEPYLAAVDAESQWLMRTHGIDGMGTVRSTAGWPVAFRFEAAPGWSAPLGIFNVLRQRSRRLLGKQ